MDLLIELLNRLDSHQTEYHTLNLYARGEQPLAFLSPESKKALGNRFGRIASNIPRLAVTSLAERLRVTGFTGADVWDDWLRNDMDQLASVAIREALILGQSFLIVWADENGVPRITVESAEQVAVRRNPITREVTAAVKRVFTAGETHAYVYLPDRVDHWVADQAHAAASAMTLIDTVPNPLGVVPVVPVTNSDRLLDCDGRSEIIDLMPLVDGLNKTLADLAVAQEFTARPRRWATGIELEERPVLDGDGNAVVDPDTGEPVLETVNPIPEGNRAMISEHHDARFGQLEGADLKGYEAAVRIWLGQIMAVSALPAHMIGILHDQPTSADALRASEASLTARAESRQASFGKAFEQAARLVIAVRDGVDPAGVVVRVQWADPATRSQAQESDAAVKLFQAGILSRTAVLRRLGYSDEQIAEELANVTRDAKLGQDIRLSAYLSDVA